MITIEKREMIDVSKKSIWGSNYPKMIELKRKEKIWDPDTMVQNMLLIRPALSGHSFTQSDMNFPWETHMIAAPIPYKALQINTEAVRYEPLRDGSVAKYAENIQRE